MSSRYLWNVRAGLLAAVFACVSAALWGGTSRSCETVTLDGEVSAGQEWKIAIGRGWIFRVVPIPPLQAGYSGWDLVVDRERAAGFPDALYVATPPYGSINEREIGTTFGLRAQDAIGWNPRTFRFLVDPNSLSEAQELYRAAFPGKEGSAAVQGGAEARLLAMQKTAATGELRIVDARLVPGTGDPAVFAQQWATAASRGAGYQVEPAGAGANSPRGALRWMRFRIALWLPQDWKAPRELHARRAPCGE